MSRFLHPFDQIFPLPRSLGRLPGQWRPPRRITVALGDARDEALRRSVELLRLFLPRRHRSPWTVARKLGGTGVRPAGGNAPDILIVRTPATRGPQSYRLRIGPSGVWLGAADEAGLRNGVLTLAQLLCAAGATVPAADIEDAPDFAVRGVLLDISRDKVPTMSTLRRIVALLARCKINQLQLYTEHAFAYRRHRAVWRGRSPMTGAQVRQLDAYCKRVGIELVPNQNSFGHMERWLKHRPYARLAETRGPWRTPWGTMRDRPSMLCPLDPGSIRHMASLYRELLPNFSSRLFNVGCDETFELGQGRSKAACRRLGKDRVYLDYLLKLYRLVRGHKRRMMLWADVLLKSPRVIRRLPQDAIALIWGYEANHPFNAECRRLARAGREFYVCPGTSSWCSFAGRSKNCLDNLRNAALAGARHGAAGYVITDWGDFGHRQYLPASWAGLIRGAALAWCAEANKAADLSAQVDRLVWDDAAPGLARLWIDAGRVHESAGVTLKNRTILFDVMQRPLRELSRGPLIGRARIRAMTRRIDALATAGRGLRPRGPDARLSRDELLATLAVLRHACRRAEMAWTIREEKSIRDAIRFLSADMGRIMATHRRLWLARNRPGGLVDSLSYYERLSEEYHELG